MRARLTFYETDRPARQYLLDEAVRYLIGRDKSCAILIADGTLSRRHAKLEFHQGVWRLSDLASKNGTLIAGRPINHHQLIDDEWIEFGSVLACFDRVTQASIDADEQRIGEQWQSSVQLSRVLTPSMETSELLARLLESFVTTSGSERGFIMLQQASGEFCPDVVLPHGITDFTGSRSVVDKTFDENRPVVCSDVSQDARLGPQPSIVSGAISALACVPLRVGEQVLGVIYVDSRRSGKQFTELDIELLQALADHAALVVSVSRLRENIVDLSEMLPAELNRDIPPDEALISKLQRLLPRLKNPGKAPGATVAGADS
ncbi:MAG: GAF domain-containing protein [Gammaproteobacteria bacterium]|nr:GAF domain-containing protein [Gammaproteobacteria bacterium]